MGGKRRVKHQLHFLITPWHGNARRISGPLCGILLTKGQWCGALMFPLFLIWTSCWLMLMYCECNVPYCLMCGRGCVFKTDIQSSAYINALILSFHSSPPGQNGRQFGSRHFKCILQKFVPKSRIDNKPALIQVMAWRWIWDKPLSEAMLTRFIDVPRVRSSYLHSGILYTDKTSLFWIVTPTTHNPSHHQPWQWPSSPGIFRVPWQQG